MLCPMMVLLSPHFLACTHRPLLRSGRYGTRLEARTWTGRCTMDLAELRTVRYITLLGRPRPSPDLLILTDRHGVHLCIDCRSSALRGVDEALYAAFKDRAGGRVAPDARISRAALERLGMNRQPAWIFVLKTMLGFALLLGWPVLCFAAVGRFVIGPLNQWVV